MRYSGGPKEKLKGGNLFSKGGVNYIYLPPTPAHLPPAPLPVGVPLPIIPTLGRGVICTCYIERLYIIIGYTHDSMYPIIIWLRLATFMRRTIYNVRHLILSPSSPPLVLR